MRVMNNRLDSPRHPVKGAVVARGTKHLVASTNLVYTSAAFGTSARFRINEFRGCQIVGVAYMRCILCLALHFVTVFACPHIAEIAFPLGAEKTATICGGIWTRSYKGGVLTLGGG